MQPMFSVDIGSDSSAGTLLSRHAVIWASCLDLRHGSGFGGTFWKGMH
jgi:hypothetical protein